MKPDDFIFVFLGLRYNIFQLFEHGDIYVVNEYFANAGFVFFDYPNFYKYFRGTAT
jgi:hypothetical protein